MISICCGAHYFCHSLSIIEYICKKGSFFSLLHCQSFISKVNLIDVLFLCQSCKAIQYALVYFQSSLSHMYAFVRMYSLEVIFFRPPKFCQVDIFKIIYTTCFQYLPINSTGFPFQLSLYILAHIFHKQLFGCPYRWKILQQYVIRQGAQVAVFCRKELFSIRNNAFLLTGL